MILVILLCKFILLSFVATGLFGRFNPIAYIEENERTHDFCAERSDAGI